MTEVYMGRVRHSCRPPVRLVPTPRAERGFPGGVRVDIDHLPDGRRLTIGMRWRCPVCLALWGAERPAPNVFLPRWMKLSSGFWWRVLRTLFGVSAPAVPQNGDTDG